MSSSGVSYEALNGQHGVISCDEKGRLTLKLATSTEYLTKRETEILNYVVQGYSAKRIGQLLEISFRTVESYITMLKVKFRCNRKNDLISICIRLGILQFHWKYKDDEQS
jgi:DNA-binding CsgD family transcriptional regulator